MVKLPIVPVFDAIKLLHVIVPLLFNVVPPPLKVVESISQPPILPAVAVIDPFSLTLKLLLDALNAPFQLILKVLLILNG